MITVPELGTLQSQLNRLAGTTGLDSDLAANLFAGTEDMACLGALNHAAGTVGLELRAVCNKIAGTTDLDEVRALATAYENYGTGPGISGRGLEFDSDYDPDYPYVFQDNPHDFGSDFGPDYALVTLDFSSDFDPDYTQ